MQKLISWNVNGLRSVARKGFHAWLEVAQPDVLSLQEIRAWPNQLADDLLYPLGYKSFFACAQKKGYSGVAIYTRGEPLDVIEGLGDPAFDREGRTLTARFHDFTLINAYFPNGQRDHAREQDRERDPGRVVERRDGRAHGPRCGQCVDVRQIGRAHV